EFRSSVADVQPGELIGRRVDVAYDVAAPQRQGGSSHGVGQNRRQYAGDEQSARPGVRPRPGVRNRCHLARSDAISTRADRPGSGRSVRRRSRIRSLTGTLWTTRTKLHVALSEGSRLNDEPLPGAKLSTTPSSASSG